MNRAFAIATIVLALLLSLTMVEVAVANPIIDPLVHVESPQNNKIYPSNTVQLNFTAIRGFNYTAYYYVLDEQSPKITNGATVLNDLSPGSHTLKIYANGTFTSPPNNMTHENYDMLVDVVYFSTFYSTAWVVFTVIIAFVITIVLILCWKRRQIAIRLRGEKNAAFKLGASLLFVGAGFFVPSAWQVANNYLFPFWPPIAVTRNANFHFTLGLCGISMGLLLIWLGTRKKKATQSKPEHDTLTVS